jgi:hypothetical protein
MTRIVFLLLFLVVSCQKTVHHYHQEDLIISSKGQGNNSTTAGNLMTSAMRVEKQLDVVLYPTEFIYDDTAGMYSSNMQTQDVDNILKMFPNGTRDKFRIGYMQGSDIKTFIRQRTLEKYKVDFEVAGVSYDILIKGGLIISEQYSFEGKPLSDERRFIVAISDHFIRPGSVFPPYEFRNSIDRIFTATDTTFSAKESLKDFLQQKKKPRLLSQKRASVRFIAAKDRGFKTIPQIQGETFISPYYGSIVTTTGIITAIGKVKDLPGGYIAYAQSEKPDNNPHTSEGVKLYFLDDPKLSMGDKVKLRGEVFEELSNLKDALTTTCIRKITELEVLSKNHTLPEAFELKEIPQHRYSTYVGDLNLKSKLNLNDAIDFWESLEGMRVKIHDPRIVGFRGGKETVADEKRHLTLYVMPKTNAKKLDTPFGGVYNRPLEHIHNPDILNISSGPLTNAFNVKSIYKIGEVIPGEIEGIITFTKNLFGEGEYLFQIPQTNQAIDDYNQLKNNENTIATLAERPKLEANLEERDLVIASYNIKNLSAIDDPENQQRLKLTGEMINTNLQCPDILGLVEIQDNNGEDFSSGSAAEKTIQQLINYIPATGACSNADYRSININPLSHREGGVPGANIRVAMIYNQNRVQFKENPLPGPRVETIILPDGHLNYNPGRIAPRSNAFQNTRKSIVAQFEFQGKPVFVVVNHFNSKLSDTSHLSAIQPVVRTSEIKRQQMAEEVRRFVSRIEQRNSQANVAVIGDFNAYVNEAPMLVLEKNVLYNLMRKLKRNQWYTTNHNGNSQALDYIFVNKTLQNKLKTFQVPQLNSDYMGRLSDHDPVIGVFSF